MVQCACIIVYRASCDDAWNFSDKSDISIVITKMDKAEINKLLVAKSERITFLPGDGTSSMWPNDSHVVVNGVICRHVPCNMCKTISKWKAKDRTSRLKAHLQSCKGDQIDAAAGLRKLMDLDTVSHSAFMQQDKCSSHKIQHIRSFILVLAILVNTPSRTALLLGLTMSLLLMSRYPPYSQSIVHLPIVLCDTSSHRLTNQLTLVLTEYTVQFTTFVTTTCGCYESISLWRNHKNNIQFGYSREISTCIKNDGILSKQLRSFIQSYPCWPSW